VKFLLWIFILSLSGAWIKVIENSRPFLPCMLRSKSVYDLNGMVLRLCTILETGLRLCKLEFYVSFCSWIISPDVCALWVLGPNRIVSCRSTSQQWLNISCSELLSFEAPMASELRSNTGRREESTEKWRRSSLENLY
jgi:hypothetical protein